MIEENHTFSSKSLVTDTPVEIEGKPKKTRHAVRKSKSKAVETPKKTSIERQLTYIYQDEQGRLPDMKKITIKKSNPALKFVSWILVVGSLLAVAAWVGFFFMPGKRNVSAEQLSLQINGPAEITAGVTTTYGIVFKNETGVALQGAVINVQYPQGFVFVTSSLSARNSGNTEWLASDIMPYQRKELLITGIMHGSMNQEQSWRVLITYQPDNFSSQLQTTAVFPITIVNTPFSLRIAGPDKVTIGTNVEYAFVVTKETETTIQQLEVMPMVPEGFSLISSSPELNKDRIWVIDYNKKTTTTNDKLHTLKLVGRFSSSSVATTEVKAVVGSRVDKTVFTLAEAAATTEFVQHDIDFKLAINGSLDTLNTKPGDMLNITVYVKNISAEPLKNVTIKLTLDAPSVNRQSILDWPNITDELDGGIKGTQVSEPIRRGEIIWDKEAIRALTAIEPQQEVSIDIRLPIRDAERFHLTEATAHQISATADIAYFDKNNSVASFSSNPLTITLNSDLAFEARDSVSREGGKEIHAITWVLTNNFHAVKNVTVSANVYGDISWASKDKPPAGQVVFLENEKRIIWTIPEIPEGVDVLALPFTVTINNPNPTQNVLVSKARIEADDAVTGEHLGFLGEEIPLNQ